MEPSILERLTHTEADFLLAISQGGPPLISFRDRWLRLLQDMENATRIQSISDETISLGGIIASRIAIMSESLLDFQTSADMMQSELEGIFAGININDKLDIVHPEPPSKASRDPSPSNPSTAQQETTDATPHSPLYIESAQKWLLENLHNPYPSKSIRDVLASSTASDRKCLDAWFIDARKRIGWNTLRREQFSNKRIDIVDAAMRFFGGHDSRRRLDENIQFQFLAIEMRAKELYAERFSESILATKLDVAVKDMTPEIKAQAKADGMRRKQQARAARDRALRDAQAASSYPSPHRSLSGTPEPLLPSDEPDLSIVPPVSVTGRKRSSSPESDSELSFNQLNKRSRIDIPAEIDVGTTSLPSPAPSFSEPLLSADDSRNPSLTPSSATPPSRKRRLSDSDGHGAPKRPRNIPSGPRLHSVSDPLPSSSTLSSWFESHFGIPSMINVDLSLPFDVELYDYSSAAPPMDPLSSATESATYQIITSSPSFEATLPVPDTPAYPLNITTNNFDYNELFCDPEDDVFGTQDNLNHTNRSWFPTFDPSFSYTETSLDATTTIPDVAVIADPSAPISHNPESNFDWMFPPLISYNTSDPLNNLEPNDFRQDGTFNAYPSKVASRVLGLSDHTTVHASAEATKAAKQRKLMEMKEATRRLEAEIAAS